MLGLLRTHTRGATARTLKPSPISHSHFHSHPHPIPHPVPLSSTFRSHVIASTSPSPRLSLSCCNPSRSFGTTLGQLLDGIRKPRRYKQKRRYLEGSPQRKATVLKVYTMTPRKPNSAIRKVARIGIIGKRIPATKIRPIFKITAYIPGAGHTLVKHNSVLVRGGRTVDLPGLKYKLIRGATGSGRIKNRKKRARYDLPPVLNLKNARSKYGVKRVKE